MSMTKTQIYDGFATIRARGLYRSRSRAEQLDKQHQQQPELQQQQQHLQHYSNITKSDSMPLYETNNNINANIINNNNNNNNNDKNYELSCNYKGYVTAPRIHHKHPRKDFQRLLSDDDRPYRMSAEMCRSFPPPSSSITLSSSPSSSITTTTTAAVIESDEPIDYECIVIPPAPAPTDPVIDTYKSEFKIPKSPSDDYFLYRRPDSPKYGQISLIENVDIRTKPPTSPPSPSSSSSFCSGGQYRKTHHFDLPLRSTSLYVPKKANSLQYRKSYSHQPPAKVLYEDDGMLGIDSTELSARNGGGGGDDGRISPSAPTVAAAAAAATFDDEYNPFSFRMKPTDEISAKPLFYSNSESCTELNSHRFSTTLSGSDYRRRCATLNPSKDKQQLQYYHQHQQQQQQQQHQQPHHLQQRRQHQFQRQNSFEIHSDFIQSRNECDEIEYLDPLDCKIGCQTTLRSKPRIPWYELAIRRENRRQSCPPIQAHVVAAFEQSLSNMTQRLQHLSATADRKDGELTEMRQTIELLRKQSIQAGLTSAHMHSMNEQPATVTSRLNDAAAAINAVAAAAASSTTNATAGGAADTSVASTINSIQRHHSSDSMCSLNSISSGCSAQDKKKKKGWLRSSFTKAFSRNAKMSKTSRNASTSSNLNSTLTAVSSASNGGDAASLPPPHSPTKSPHKMMTVIENAKPVDALDDANPLVEDLKKQLREKDLVLTDIRLEALSSASQLESLKDTVIKMRHEMMSLKQNNERLQKMVTSRSLAGSEVSLGGPISPSGSIGEPRRYSLADGNMRPPLELPKRVDETEEEDIPPAPAPEPPPAGGTTAAIIRSPTSAQSQLPMPPPAIDAPVTNHLPTTSEDINDHMDGKKISIAVYLGQPEHFQKYAEDVQDTDPFYIINHNDDDDDDDAAEEVTLESKPKSYVGSNRTEFTIAYTYISGKTTWQNLDYIVRKTFKDYLARIDPGTNLGLNTDSITSYHLGEAKRGPEIGFPELLPCGYIVGNVKTLYICLQGVGSLAFESLIPRSYVHTYIRLLTEHRRLILCGPSGTGKSYLARKLAEFLVTRSQRGNPSEAIATFNVDHKSSKELRQYLGHIAEQASMSNGASELPSVIILDNLHHAIALGDVFQALLSAGPAAKLPCIIGTMSQATCNITNLQLNHNFRWVLTANLMEPVKGFLGRYLRRRLFSLELATQTPQLELAAVLAWLPDVWHHINRFLESHSSSDVTIGPRLFLSCPLDLKDSQVWFTDVWNYHLEPYLIEAVREGVQLYGRRVGKWIDPSTFIRDTYPWPMINGTSTIPSLRLINAADVGLEGNATGNLDADPLLNMLMRLQEAANYSVNQEQESDCASLDSNITQDSSAGADIDN